MLNQPSDMYRQRVRRGLASSAIDQPPSFWPQLKRSTSSIPANHTSKTLGSPLVSRMIHPQNPR